MIHIDPRQLRRPPALTQGDTIGIVLPAGPIHEEEHFIAGVRLLREAGFEVRHRRDIMRRRGYLAGTDEERTQEFIELWADPQIKAVMAARGGYGSLRTIARLPKDLMKSETKILAGFSDISVLHAAALGHGGIVAFHSPTVTTLTRSDRETVTSFLDVLTGAQRDRMTPRGIEILRPGRARGTLLGGNLTSLVHLLGTAYELSWQNAILFLEDVGEAPYRVDRLFTHLAEAGRLAGLAGLILGEFHHCGDVELIWNRVLELVGDSGIPIWAGFPVGHGATNLTMPLGIEAEMADGTLGFLSGWHAS